MKPKKDFSPAISSYNNQELIAISVSTAEFWHAEAVLQAREELLKRDLPGDMMEALLKKWKGVTVDDELARLKQLAINEKAGYSVFAMLYIFLFAPSFMSGRMRFDKSLVELKRGGFKLKYRQRALMIYLGLAFWIIVIILSFIYLQ